MLLAIDTATGQASVAVYDLEKRLLLAEESWQARRRQTQETLGVARTLLSLLGLTSQSITALAVTTGPGSFTGVRIAISTAKGIVLGLPKRPRVVGFPTLCVSAAPWQAIAAQSDPSATICACIQAGRGRFNWVFFAPNKMLWRPEAADHHAGVAQEFAEMLAQRAPQPVWLVGETTKPLLDALAGEQHIAVIDPVSSMRRAGQLAQLAALHFEQNRDNEPQDLRPLYLRSPG